MESVPTAELIELLLNLVNQLDLQFQYWLSVSFAVIVTSYIAGDRLSMKIRIYIFLLYILASSIFSIRYFGSRTQVLFLSQELLTRVTDWPNLGGLTSPVRQFTFIAGIIGTTWFLLFSKSKKELTEKTKED